MNGANILLFSQIGFWHDIVTAKLPDARFLVQRERYSLEELIINFVRTCLITNLSGGDNPLPENRVRVPITNPEVTVTDYLACKKENRCSCASKM